MEKVSFTKMSGAGNDFIMIDKIVNPLFSPSESVIQKLCNRRNGIGADGLITIEHSDNSDFRMTYYNADGSTGSLCGNGARCAISFAGMTGKFTSGKTDFIANNISYKGEILDDESVKFYMNPPGDTELNLNIRAADQQLKCSFINTGSPHVIVNVDDLKNESGSNYSNVNDVPVVKIGSEIRYHDRFTPGGTNVNFILAIDKKIFIRTYERGVEDETLACGTGSAAAAVAAYYNFKMEPPITLKTFGGEELVVDFKVENSSVTDLSLTGPAKIIYTGQFLLQSFI